MKNFIFKKKVFAKYSKDATIRRFEKIKVSLTVLLSNLSFIFRDERKLRAEKWRNTR